jgi:hypothetical protein
LRRKINITDETRDLKTLVQKVYLIELVEAYIGRGYPRLKLLREYLNDKKYHDKNFKTKFKKEYFIKRVQDLRNLGNEHNSSDWGYKYYHEAANRAEEFIRNAPK